jgi:hypothetical protein
VRKYFDFSAKAHYFWQIVRSEILECCWIGRFFTVSSHSQMVSVPGESFSYSILPRGDVGCRHVLRVEEKVRQKPSASVARVLATFTQSAACAAESDKLKRSAAPVKEVVSTLRVVTDALNALQVECVKTAMHATTGV